MMIFCRSSTETIPLKNPKTLKLGMSIKKFLSNSGVLYIITKVLKRVFEDQILILVLL